MKNYGLIISVTLLLIVVGLSGCQEKTGNGGNQQIDSRFIASWTNVEFSPDVEIWTFYTNGSTMSYSSRNFEGGFINLTTWYNFTVDSDQLCLFSKDVAPSSPLYLSICFSYSFSENLNRLMLSDEGTIIMDFNKIS